MKYSSCSSFRNLRRTEKKNFVKKYITIIIDVIHARYIHVLMYKEYVWILSCNCQILLYPGCILEIRNYFQSISLFEILDNPLHKLE